MGIFGARLAVGCGIVVVVELRFIAQRAYAVEHELAEVDVQGVFLCVIVLYIAEVVLPCVLFGGICAYAVDLVIVGVHFVVRAQVIRHVHRVVHIGVGERVLIEQVA